MCSSKCPFLPLALNKNNNNKHAEYHDIFIPFKGQIYSKQGRHISLLFGKWTFSIIFPCLGEAKVSTVNSDLTNFVDVQGFHEHVPIMLTKNQVKAISVHFIKKKLPSSVCIYVYVCVYVCMCIYINMYRNLSFVRALSLSS